MARVLDQHGVDAVCHFAAESHVDRSIARPDDFVQTNIIGTYTLLELVRERKDRITLFQRHARGEL